MSNITQYQGLCPAPFLQESLFPEGGYVLGRFCASIPGVAEGRSCCLPCPATDYTFPSNFYSLTRIAGYISCVALFLCLVALVSYAVLPAEKTRRHYLNVCLIISIIFIQLGFIVPWAVRPNQCHNLITPNDLTTSMTCAWGGALIVCGGASVNAWILIRAVSMHLQIVWDIRLGRKFFWCAQLIGWGITVILCACELSLSGVSFRFGDYCHVNHHNSLATLWGPLLVLAGVSLITQLATFGYCLRVYLKHAINGPSHMVSSRSQLSNSSHSSSKDVYRRVRKVLALQWRGLAIAFIVLIDVVFFSIVFVVLDGQNADALKNPTKFMPWLTCLAYKGKDECLNLAKPLGMNEGILIAILILLSITGIEAFLLLYRWEMFTSWISFFRNRRERREFVSLDAHRYSLGALDPRSRGNSKFGTTSTASMSPASPEYVHPKGPVTFVVPMSPGEKEVQVQSPPQRPARPPNFSSPFPHEPRETGNAFGSQTSPRQHQRQDWSRAWIHGDTSRAGEEV